MTSSVQAVKEELAHVRAPRRCCRVAELSALLHLDGTYRIAGGGGHSLVTESAGVHTTRKIHELMRSLFEVETSVIKVQRSTPRHGKVYDLEFCDQPGFHQTLYELGVLSSALSPEPSIPSRIVRSDCCVSAALRGAFLGGGYLGEPYRAADLEITYASRSTADSFLDLFARKTLDPGIRARRNQWILYLKSRSKISEFLAVTGAHHAHLEWESHAIMKLTRNEVNRLVNCDAANARRLAESSMKQREAVGLLKETGGIDGLEQVLVELAEARLANPQASLAELAQLMCPPVSKHVVHGRMRRLMARAEAVRKRD